ncbi:hypothetical protein [Thiomicrorhabdus xiamenensis]|uniref:Uncharacterized protein n=1 Tax=Thiomicrorhabdus xiamenensis TaxID=2739063 RepID=A0A7D4SMF6_9GAMM|nr:hypothetical protein [Thiomicrorhabdus xiamenensis]QKI88501.1 hypothetical protein HQN79_02390 [Thiomicrorhabdus xiamenensis]
MLSLITGNDFLNRLADASVGKHLFVPGIEDDLSRRSQPAGYAGEPSDTRFLASDVQVERGFQYSENMSLQLTTKEGDRVTVDFRQLYASYQSYKEMMYAETRYAQDQPQGNAFYKSFETMQTMAFAERFAFSVQGELNLDELKAVFEVFDQVDAIANQFYGGNLEQALQSAQTLKMDFGQLQSMQLNLTQSASYSSLQQQAAIAEYGAVQDVNQSVNGINKFSSLEQLPEYYQKWQSALETLNEWFEDASKTWVQLTAKVAAQRFPDQGSEQMWLARMESFHRQLDGFNVPTSALRAAS